MSVSVVHSGPRKWSINALADELGIDRRTVKKRIGDTPPCGKLNGHPVWYLRDIAFQLFDAGGNGEITPKDRLDIARAKWEELRYSEKVRELIPSSEVELVVGMALKEVAQSLDAIPDMLERDCALNAEQVMLVTSAMDAARMALYTQLLNLSPTLEMDEDDDAGN